jgi:hypothetical protein
LALKRQAQYLSETMPLLIIFIFAACGLFLIALGIRGTPTPAGPRCARCGYDLRGAAGTTIERCSECGNDLSIPSAIRRDRSQRRPGKIVAGVAVVALPWLLIGGLLLGQFIGLHGERFRSNRSIIAAISTDPSWESAELDRRLNAGSLSKDEASAAVEQFVVYDEHHPNWPFTVTFLQSANRAGAVTGDQLLRLAQSLCGKTPDVFVHPVRSNETTFVDIVLHQSFWPLPGHAPTPVVRGIWLDQRPFAEKGSESGRESTSQPTGTNLCLGAGLNWMAATKLPPGDYQAHMLIDFYVSPFVGGLVSAAPSQANIGAKWTVNVTVPVTVLPPAIRSSLQQPPPLRIETDPNLDPLLNGEIKITLVDTLCYTDRTVMIVHAKVLRRRVMLYLASAFTVAGKTYPGIGQPMFLSDNFEMNDFLIGSCELGKIPEAVHSIDFELRPDFNDAAKTELAQPFWGKPMIFHNVPLRRRWCDFSLMDWRASHPNGVATTKPSLH